MTKDKPSGTACILLRCVDVLSATLRAHHSSQQPAVNLDVHFVPDGLNVWEGTEWRQLRRLRCGAWFSAVVTAACMQVLLKRCAWRMANDRFTIRSSLEVMSNAEKRAFSKKEKKGVWNHDFLSVVMPNLKDAKTFRHFSHRSLLHVVSTAVWDSVNKKVLIASRQERIVSLRNNVPPGDAGSQLEYGTTGSLLHASIRCCLQDVKYTAFCTVQILQGEVALTCVSLRLSLIHISEPTRPY